MENGQKGAYNKAPVFTRENYSYWKECMCIHINSVDRNIWNVIVNGPMAITITNDAGVTRLKPQAQWDEKDEKNYAYDWKARNMIITSLGVDEYFLVSHCQTAKAMWDALQVAHEGTNDVKLARINTLTQEFDIFHMKQGETVAEMQKIFSHIINRLHTLGHITPNAVATNKVLRCLSRERQPKVTNFKEANDLSTLDLTALFGKLEEHEQDLMNLNKHEKKEKKEKSKDTEKKSIALKASSSKSFTKDTCDSESSDEEESQDEDMGLFVRRYNKYLRKNEIKHSDNNLVDYRRQSKSNKQDEYKKTKPIGSCYNCGMS